MAASVRREREFRFGYSLPFPRWCEIERLSNTRAYGLLSTGEVDSILIGSRRFVILASWVDYLQRQCRGEARDPAEKAAAAQRFAGSAERSRAQYAPKHGKDRRIGYPSAPKQLKTRETIRTNSPPTAGPAAEPRPRLASRPAKDD